MAVHDFFHFLLTNEAVEFKVCSFRAVKFTALGSHFWPSEIHKGSLVTCHWVAAFFHLGCYGICQESYGIIGFNRNQIVKAWSQMPKCRRNREITMLAAVMHPSINHHLQPKTKNANSGKLTWQWKVTSIWRSMSYWKWWFSIAILVWKPKVKYIPSRELTYPTLGQGNSSSKNALVGDMLFPRRVCFPSAFVHGRVLKKFPVFPFTLLGTTLVLKRGGWP